VHLESNISVCVSAIILPRRVGTVPGSMDQGPGPERLSGLGNCWCIVVRRGFEQKETKVTKELGCASAFFSNRPRTSRIRGKLRVRGLFVTFGINRIKARLDGGWALARPETKAGGSRSGMGPRRRVEKKIWKIGKIWATLFDVVQMVLDRGTRKSLTLTKS
jgi:hypothetical protein